MEKRAAVVYALGMLLDAEKCWQAVSQRDVQSNGDFVYGVLSTRIFCRPSCPARRPQRGGVQFFERPTEAVAAGFRACKRCRPEQALGVTTERIQQACRLIEENLDSPLSLAELSRHLKISPSHLQRSFKKQMGLSPRDYSEALRSANLKTALQNGATVTIAIFDAGYNSSRSVYERASSQLGMTPATYRKGGSGMKIVFDVVPSTLGMLLVAITERGVCAVSLGDDEAGLDEILRQEFHSAQVLRDAKHVRPAVQTVLQLLEGKAPRAELPLDVRATAFQWRVWQELRKIGVGETRSYSQIAQQLGQPTAARAVARACASNPVALLVPCHRVVRGNGELSGYRWGVERKEKLLKREATAAQKEKT